LHGCRRRQPWSLLLGSAAALATAEKPISGKGKVPYWAAHDRRRGERDGFRVSRYFTALPLPFNVMIIWFILM